MYLHELNVHKSKNFDLDKCLYMYIVFQTFNTYIPVLSLDVFYLKNADVVYLFCYCYFPEKKII